MMIQNVEDFGKTHKDSLDVLDFIVPADNMLITKSSKKVVSNSTIFPKNFSLPNFNPSLNE